MGHFSRKDFQNKLAQEVLLMDGAMGTTLERTQMPGSSVCQQGFCHDELNLSDPKLVQQIHQSYLDSGADIIGTHTFQASALDLAQFGEDMSKRMKEINQAAVANARVVLDKSPRPIFLAGICGPTHISLSIDSKISFETLTKNFYEQIKILIQEEVDYILLETVSDGLNFKAQLEAIKTLESDLNQEIPFAVTFTLLPDGRINSGMSLKSLVYSLKSFTPLYIGINCSTGPDFMFDHIQELDSFSPFPIACIPNAGLPNEKGEYKESAESMANLFKPILKKRMVNLIGGCCGTTPKHIKGMSQLDLTTPKISFKPLREFSLSARNVLEITSENRPYFIGTLRNKEHSARELIQKGVEILNPGGPPYNLSDIAPLFIEVDESDQIHSLNTQIQGKPLFFLPGEKGEEIEKAFNALASRKGSLALEGKAFRKFQDKALETRIDLFLYAKLPSFPLENNLSSFCENLLNTKKDSPCLVDFSSLDSLESEKKSYWSTIALHFLADKGVEVCQLDVFSVQNILSYPQKLVNLGFDYLSNPTPELWDLAGKALAANKTESGHQSQTPLVSRIKKCLIHGEKKKIMALLEEGLKEYSARELLDGSLAKGMERVGELFKQNKIILSEVLQAAEVMKAAIFHLDPYLKEKEESHKGTLLLATVKGDVHDIGLKLVEIIFENHGFKVINLGTEVTLDILIEAIKKHSPFLLAFSGLLAKSAKTLRELIKDLDEAGFSLPIIMGGAAMNTKFVDLQIAPHYSGFVECTKDLIYGVKIANELLESSCIGPLQEMIIKRRIESVKESQKKIKKPLEVSTQRSTSLPLIEKLPQPPHLNKEVLEDCPIEEIWKWINPLMLYGRHLGVKGRFVRYLVGESVGDISTQKGGEKALEIFEEVEKVKKLYGKSHFKANGIYQFFSVKPSGNSIHFEGQNIAIEFPRQIGVDGLCLSDYLHPQGDSMALFLVTVGKGLKNLAEQLYQEGNYLQSHIVSALALESAEAFAEFIHSQIRSVWGLADDQSLKLKEIFQAKYHGLRYSFGYPACPNLENQKKIFELLKPEKDLQVLLTDGFMMKPESTISAMCFHHPDASYFSVGDLSNYDGV